MHFSARSLVFESVTTPSLYYHNNVVGTLNLLKTMEDHGVDRLIFSSTASVYGMPTQKIIDEAHPLAPITPYGSTKLMVERILEDFSAAHKLRSVSLRYFNAAGADPAGETGEAHDPETHLIPNILKSLLKKTSSFKVYGSDYPTADGTCIRDYVHVNDLCEAHLLALQYIEDPWKPIFSTWAMGKDFRFWKL